MFYGTIYKNSDANTRYQTLLLGVLVSNVDVEYERVVDIKDLFPYWILERSESNNPVNFLVNFVQEYYNWLYIKSGYELNKTSYHYSGFSKLTDINETPTEFLKHFAYSYATGLSTQFIGATSGPSDDNVREFLKGIRKNLYMRKSTEEAYRYFFQSLFGTKGTDVSIQYPKQTIFRLNGGKFDDQRWDDEFGSNTDMPWNESDGLTGYYENLNHLGGSFLNGNYKIQDSDFYQDFSYVIKAGVNVVNEETGLPVYYEDLNTMLHPAGTKGFFEKTINDYVPPDDFDGNILQGERPVLGNYFAYRLSNTGGIGSALGTTGYSACIGCCGSAFGYDGPTAYIGATLGTFGGSSGGWTMGQGWGAVGGGGISADYNLPTHQWPTWDGDIDAGLTFGGIYIRDFIYLYPSTSSPNIGITGCTSGTGQCWT